MIPQNAIIQIKSTQGAFHAIHNPHSDRHNRNNTSRIRAKANKSKNVSRYDRNPPPIKSTASLIC